MNTIEVNPFALPSLPLVERSGLPNLPAIYFVIAGEQVVYIGQTKNLVRRLLTHDKLKKFTRAGAETRIAWLECNELSLLRQIESVLIEYFAPTLNGRDARSKRSEKINFTCEPEDKEYLRNWAAKEGRTLSNLVERIVKDAIIKDRENNQPTSNKKGAA